MSDMEDKNTWGKTVDLLRLATPVFIGILGYLFLGFQGTLEKNTDAVNQFRTDMAVMSEKSKNVDSSVGTLVVRVDNTTRDVADIKSRLTLIESRIKTN